MTSARARSGGEVADVVDAFRRILRELRVVARKTEVATGLSAAQMFVLSAVAAKPGASINDVARATMTDRSSAAAIVDRLVELGYATRTAAGDDRRRASVALTSRGRSAVTSAASPAPTALLIEGLEQLPASQRRSLARGLVALTRAMGIADQPAPMLFEDALQSRTRPRGER